MVTEAILQTESKREFYGFCPDYQEAIAQGELIFSTGMTGYVEALTDPSYKGQLLVFTYPLIGNYGVPEKTFWESEKIQAAGVIICCPSMQQAHRQGEKTFLTWLKEENIPVIWGVDTRAVTKILREEGSLLAAFGPKNLQPKFLSSIKNPNECDLLSLVSTKAPYTLPLQSGQKKKKVLVVDCGVKKNILRCLQNLGVCVHVVPYDYDYTEENFDGIVISNGPGNPEKAEKTIAILKKELRYKRPVLGICLGAQLMALASGANTYKLPFGHRGQNQPCYDQKKGLAFLTTQNHGWAIARETLPKEFYVQYINLNDQSVEGIAHKTKPHIGVQFHPESNPGPNDARHLFATFTSLL